MKLAQCEAAALRYVHDVVTGDFVTVGVVLLCPEASFIGGRFAKHFKRVKATFPEADAVHLRRVCIAMTKACDAWQLRASDELPLAKTSSLSPLLTSLLPPEDAALQFSPVISGVTRDPARTLDELFVRFVGPETEKVDRNARTEEEVWRAFAKRLPDPALVKRFQVRTIESPRFSWDFDYAWKNGTWHAVQPLSLDLVDPHKIRDKAAAWSGRIWTVRPRDHELEVKILVGVPGPSRMRTIHTAAADGIEILRENLRDQAQIVAEPDSAALLQQVVQDLAHDTA